MLTSLVINYRNDSEAEFLGKVKKGEISHSSASKTMGLQGNREQNSIYI